MVWVFGFLVFGFGGIANAVADGSFVWIEYIDRMFGCHLRLRYRRLVFIRPRDGINIRYTIRYTIHDYSIYIATPLNSLEYPLNGTIGLNTIQSWWGNTVFTKTGDWNSVSLKTVAPGDTFGCVHFLTLFSFLFYFALLHSVLHYYSFSLPKCLGREGLLDARPEMRATFLPTPLLSLLGSFCSEGFFFPSTSGVPPFWSITSLSPLFWVRYTTFRGMCSGTLAGHPSRASLLLGTRTVTDAFVLPFSFIYSPSHW